MGHGHGHLSIGHRVVDDFDVGIVLDLAASKNEFIRTQNSAAQVQLDITVGINIKIGAVLSESFSRQNYLISPSPFTIDHDHRPYRYHDEDPSHHAPRPTHPFSASHFNNSLLYVRYIICSSCIVATGATVPVPLPLDCLP